MRVRFTDNQPIFDRAALKPAKGNRVMYEGQVYIVDEVGMRYVHMHHAETGAKGFAKINQVVKVINVPTATPPTQ